MLMPLFVGSGAWTGVKATRRIGYLRVLAFIDSEGQKGGRGGKFLGGQGAVFFGQGLVGGVFHQESAARVLLQFIQQGAD